MRDLSPDLENHRNSQLRLSMKSFSEKIEPLSLAEQFESTDSEAYHVLDCISTCVHFKNNYFDKVFKMNGFRPINILEILQLIHPEQMRKVVQFMDAVLENEKYFELGKDNVTQVFMIENEEMIMKTSTPLKADSNNHVTWVLEQYRNVTGLVRSGIYRWSFKGPNEDTLTERIRASLIQDCQLTSQELKILRFVGKGLSSQDVADILFLSKHTVDTHRRNIIRKLNVDNTLAAHDRAMELGLLAEFIK